MSARRDRAVSNTVAFVLVFSLIVTSVGLVTTAGVDSLQDVQQTQQADASASVVRAAGAGITAVATGNRPGYRSSLELGGGGLQVTNRTTVRVKVTNATGTVFDRTYRPGALRYRANDRNVTYQSGLLARGGERRRAVLLEGAGFRCNRAGDYTSLTVVRLRNPTGGAVGGGPVTIHASAPRGRPSDNVSGLAFPAERPHPTATAVELTVTGPYATAWVDALTERGFTDVGGGSFRCSVSRVFVHAPRVNIRLT
jgi:hypothetical protein